MELGAPSRRVPSTPTYVPQNDPLIALIILNTHVWGFFEKKCTPWGSSPSSQTLGGGGGGGWGGKVRGENFFPVLHANLNSL